MKSRVRTAKNHYLNLIEYDENIDELLCTKWDLKSKLDSKYVYNGNFVKKYPNGEGFSLEIIKYGFSTPVLFEDKAGLGLILPHDSFTVDDVSVSVGKNRLLDVVDVHTQDAIGMTMKDWCEYYKCPKKTQLLNVISLEYSQSKMDEMIKAPRVVLHLDWLENYWPSKLRDSSVDNKSYLKTLTYPKVRKYCLMSVAGCYTDFHIDLGGTSVWYHIFRGEKIFWLVPPTETNLSLYEQWCLSSEQSSCFFPDLVTECEKVHLKQGNTFMIPSGWIHGVYTPIDSLVFGGNFLHSLSIPLQLRIWNVEENIKVNTKYRYPFFIEMHWYMLASCVSTLNGRSYLTDVTPEDESKLNRRAFGSFSKIEIKGIQSVYRWLRRISFDCNKCIPMEVENPSQLLSDAENLCNLFLASNSDDENRKLFDDQHIHDHISIPLESDHTPSQCGNIKVPSGRKSMKINRRHKPVSLFLKVSKKVVYQKRKLKPEVTHVAEIPRQLFDQITKRTASRQIVRPNRLVENPIK